MLNFSCTEPKAYITNILNKLILHRVPHFSYLCHACTACINLFEQNGDGKSGEICVPVASKAQNEKYTCLMCINHFCMWCSSFENNEGAAGWNAANSVVYYKSCF